MDNSVKKKYKILAIDDEKFNLLLIKSCLKDSEYEIIGCEDGLEAVGTFKKEKIDCILLDIVMDSIDGFEVRELIRKFNPKVPIIFLTSMVDDVNSNLLEKITADQHSFYMRKSFSKEKLLEKIRQVHSVYLSESQAIDYYKKIESSLKLAGEVQSFLLPNWTNITRSHLISYYYEPSQVVSGDIVEFFQLPNNKVLCINGDIAGHGIQAALYMSMILSFIRSAITDDFYEHYGPHDFLNQLNAFFKDGLHGGNYMTCLLAIFDFSKNKVIYHNAGHPKPLFFSPSKGDFIKIEDEDRGGIPVGWGDGEVYKKENNIELDFDDDTIFFSYTDGLLDLAEDANGENTLNHEVFIELLRSLLMDSNVISAPFRLRSALQQIGYEYNPDDVCCITLQKNIYNNSKSLSRYIKANTSDISDSVKDFGDFVISKTQNEVLGTKIELLLSEFLNNIAIHGSMDMRQSKRFIAIFVSINSNEIIVSVMDRGKSYEYNPIRNNNVVDDEMNKLNNNMATSGRGMQIISNIVSSMCRNHYFGLNETIFTVKY